MSLLDRRANQQAPSSCPHPSSDSVSPDNTVPGLAPTSGFNADLGTDGPWPDVLPSLVEYLNQDAVRKALNKKCHDSNVAVASDRISIPIINSGLLHSPELATLPGPSELQPLSYFVQNSVSAATDPQQGEKSLGEGSGLIPSMRADGATSNTYPATHSSVFDYLNNSRDPSSGAFNPELAEIGTSNGTLTYADWFSFMRDCGIMDIEDD